MRKISGFTLVELCIVIAILGIVAAIGGPAIASWSEQRGLHIAVEELKGAVQQCKLLAIKQDGLCDVDFNTPGVNQYQVSIRENDGTLVRVVSTMDLADYKGNVTFIGDPGGGVLAPQFRFNSQGLTPNSGMICLTNLGNTNLFRVRTTMAGGISAHVWSTAAASWVHK